VVNDIEVVDTELRGHTLVVLDTYGDVVVGPTQYDTWDTVGAPGARAALASALGAVATGNIVVLVVYDASGLDAGIRSAINTGYLSTNTDTWVSGRRSHIFIGEKTPPSLLYLDAGNPVSYSGSGTTWTDLSTYQNNATLTGSPTFTNAGTASYFSFNGTNQFAPVTTSKMNVTLTGKTTIFAIRTVSANTPNATYRNLFGGNTNARNFNTYMYHVSGSTWQLQFSTGPFPWVGPLSESFTVTDNEWIVVAVTQTTGGVLTYYVNGQQIGTPATGVTFSQFINSGIEAVARADNYWRGDMGVCAVYGQALTAEQIQQNYNALSTRY
jgi:hypothetical protein